MLIYYIQSALSRQEWQPLCTVPFFPPSVRFPFKETIIPNQFLFQIIRINTFEPSCVGILGRDTYRISLLVKVVDYNFVIMTFVGMALFYYAKDLCRNVFFHYTSGVGVGIFLSLVVIIYFIQKRVRWCIFYFLVNLFI